MADIKDTQKPLVRDLSEGVRGNRREVENPVNPPKPKLVKPRAAPCMPLTTRKKQSSGG